MRLPVPLVLIAALAAAAVTMGRWDEIASLFEPLTKDVSRALTPIGAPNGVSDEKPEAAAIDVAFSPQPEGSAQRLVVKVIDSGHHSIEIAAYEFTSKPIADALVRAADRGVKVYLVADAKENVPTQQVSRVGYVATGGVSVRLDEAYAIMHNKFLVVDEETVETGSFNYTHAAAALNAENVVVLWHRPEIAAPYVKRFKELWDESRPVGG